jgi:adenosylmethionine-8-amino-7-oxononanoate aminotransferase
VGEIRGQGLLLGVEFVADRATRAPFDPALRLRGRVRQACLERGLSTYPGGGSAGALGGDHVLLAPPFIIDEEQVDLLAATLREGLDVAIAGLP